MNSARLQTIIAIAALFISIAALAIAIRNSKVSGVTKANLEREIEEALVRKEKTYVQEMTPKMEQFYGDMLPDYAPFETPPETFGTLLAPAIRIVTK